MIRVIVLATKNAGKVKEFQQLLKDFPVEIKNLNDFGPIPDVEEDGATFDDNAYKKASFASKVLGLPAIADEITTEPKGNSGFGYDPVFYFPEYGKTFAELTGEEKNKISHRGMALAQVVDEFDKIVAWLGARLSEVKPPKPDHKRFEHNDWSEDKMV